MDLTGFDPSTAVIAAFRYAADNQLTRVSVNGVDVFTAIEGASTNEFVAWQYLGDLGAGSFAPGVNTIEFEVFNAFGGPTWSGFRFEGTVEAVVPTPSSAALLLVAAAALIRRRRRAA